MTDVHGAMPSPHGRPRASSNAGGTQQLQRVTELVTDRRYLVLSVLATAIALASTYQKLASLSPAAWHELVLEQQNATLVTDAQTHEVGIMAADVENAAVVAVSTTTVFLTELMRSRVSAAIVMHFYLVVMYHLFLAIAHACFGAIRPAEIQQTKETMIHFILMRCLLLASTLGSGQKTKLGLLLIWLSTVAFLRGILSLCNARFEHLLTRPMAQVRDLHRLAFALGAVVALDLLMAATCSYVSVVSQLVVHFAWFEASLLLIKTLQLGTKVAFHMFDIGNSIEFGSEKGEFYLLILQTTLSGCYLVQLVFYYLYIISVDQFRVSFLDFILIINVKNATVQLLENLKKVKMYHQIVMDLDQLFPDATQDELDAVSDDVCVICLKPMDTQAKKLHCGHLFHRFCLRQCLQKASIGDAFTGLDNNFNRVAAGIGMETGGSAHAHANTSLRCPICRKHVHSGKPEAPQQPPVDHPAEARANDDTAAAIHGEHEEDTAAPPAAEIQPAFGPDQPPVEPETEEVIRFSTEFLSRWIPFPNFSFEIVRHRSGDGQGGGGNGAAPFLVTPEMVQQVWEVFPQYSAESIGADLMRTRSPERTIERILNGSFETQQRAHDDEREDLGDLAQAIGDIDEDLRWSVSTLWSNLWQSGDQQPSPRHARAPTMVDRNGNVAEHIAFPPEPAARNHGFPNGARRFAEDDRGAAERETLLRRLQRWREEER
uniref:RING-type domain-containing protein n=1 Tax=Globisporangium ultimum (strain ATCC 200006 / CBS 805.95 / DAOM BR144) TaxID=431595 RepID=K3WBZ1_GLOUD